MKKTEKYYSFRFGDSRAGEADFLDSRDRDLDLDLERDLSRDLLRERDLWHKYNVILSILAVPLKQYS